jgi:hypothetical protein
MPDRVAGLATATTSAAFFPPPRAAHPQREVFQRHFSPPSGGAFFTDAPSPLLDTRSVKSTDHEDDGTNTTTALVGPTARSPRPLRAALAMRTRLATVMASVVTMSQFVCFMRRPPIATPYSAHGFCASSSCRGTTRSVCGCRHNIALQMVQQLTTGKSGHAHDRFAGRLIGASIRGAVC